MSAPFESSPPPSDLAALAVEHVTWLRAVGRAPSTIRHRRSALQAFTAWGAEHGMTTPAQLTLPLLERYQVALVQRLGLRDGQPRASCGLALSALRQFGHWLVRAEQLGANPAAALLLPRRPRRLPRVVLTAGEVERVLAQPDPARPLGVRDRALLETLYSTGIRRGELCRLALADLDPAQGHLFVRQGKGGRDRVVPIGRRALGWIARYRAEVRPPHAARTGSTTLFLTQRGRMFRDNRLSELVRRYVLAAGLGKAGSCHVFRHAVATLLLENGADLRVVQEILGHAHLATTALYTHVAIGRLKAVHTASHPAERAPHLG